MDANHVKNKWRISESGNMPSAMGGYIAYKHITIATSEGNSNRTHSSFLGGNFAQSSAKQQQKGKK